jgi:hypothetical protein
MVQYNVNWACVFDLNRQDAEILTVDFLGTV